MKNQKIPYINIAGSAVFVLLVLRQLFASGGNLLEMLRYQIPFFTIVRYALSMLPLTALCALMVYTLVVNWRNVIPAYGIAAYAVLELLQTMISTVKSIFTFDFGNIFSNLPDVLYALGLCGVAFLAVVCLTNWLPNLRPLARKLWFVPGALLSLCTLIYLILSIDYLTFGYVYFMLLQLAGMFAISLWSVAPPFCPLGSVLPYLSQGVGAVSAAAGSMASNTSGTSGNTGTAPAGFFNMGLHVVMLLFTFGIWLYIWIYRTTKYLNNTPRSEVRNPVAQLLLCFFVPFYSIYWYYQTAKRVDQMAAYRGVSSDIATLSLILAIFVPIVPPIIIQSKINTLAMASAPVRSRPAGVPPQSRPTTPAQTRPTAPGQTRPAAPSQTRPAAPSQTRPAAPSQTRPAVPSQTRPAASGQTRPTAPASAPRLSQAAIDELRMYKGLMDDGIITQEEFLAHKRRILG